MDRRLRIFWYHHWSYARSYSKRNRTWLRGVYGFGCGRQSISFIGAVIAGTIGAVIAAVDSVCDWSVRRPSFLREIRQNIKIKPKHLDNAENWFNKYGAGIVFTARFVPVMRQAISIPAGMARMSFGCFTLLSALASLPWSLLFVYLGQVLAINGKISMRRRPLRTAGDSDCACGAGGYILFKVLKGRGKSV